jgi:predicted dehydrogenase
LAAAQKFLRGIDVATEAAAITQAADIDAVVVATPTGTHFTLVKDALEAGTHDEPPPSHHLTMTP